MLYGILVSTLIMLTILSAQGIGDGVRKARQVITRPFHHHKKKPAPCEQPCPSVKA